MRLRWPNGGSRRGPAALLLAWFLLAHPDPLQGQLPPGALGGPDGPNQYQCTLKGPLTDADGLRLLGPDAKNCVRFEPEGVRLTLPGNHPKERPFTGLASNF